MSDTPRTLEAQSAESFQNRVQPWMMECFGPEISADKIERNHRFLEEALELIQANGCTRSEAHQLVDYTFNRPQGDINQEVGGVMVTLAALCLANGIDMHAGGETELERVWQLIPKIRAQQAAKPRYSPLPEAQSADEPVTFRSRIMNIDGIGSGKWSHFDIEHTYPERSEEERQYLYLRPAPKSKCPHIVSSGDGTMRTFDGRFPRSLEQAFGPYARTLHTPPEPKRHWGDTLVVGVSSVGAVVMVVWLCVSGMFR